MNTRTPSIYLLLFLLLFEGIGALFGGGALILDPSGALLRMPLSLLKSSPFPNYLIPGLFLFFFLGLCPLIIFYGLLRRPNWRWLEWLNMYKGQHWAWTFSLYLGLVLILWIHFEIMFIRSYHWAHTLYTLLGVLIILLTLLPSVATRYKVEEKR